MCPPELLSCCCYVNFDWTNEQILLFLQKRSIQDPAPSNIFIDVNPFNIEPGIHLITCGTCTVQRNLAILKVSRDSKILELDTAPYGDKTGWTMLEYKMECRKQQGSNEAQGFGSLCRFFFNNNEVSCYENQDNSPTVDADSDTDAAYIETMLLSMIEQEERNLSPIGSSNGRQGPSPLSGRGLEDSEPNNAAGVHAANGFSSGDFLELNDFDDLLSSSSSSSDDSSCMLRTSDEYFDPESLLRDLKNENNLFVEESDINCKLSVSGSFRPHQEVVRPPSPGNLFSNGSHLLIGECKPTTAVSRQEMNPAAPSLAAAVPNGNKDTPRKPSERIKAKQRTSIRSEYAGIVKLLCRKPSSRIVKLGKKYCCFVSF